MRTLRKFWQQSEGFSLVEVLVALAIFALAAIALSQAQNMGLRGVSQVRAHTGAAILAENLMVQALALIPPHRAGGGSGEAEYDGQSYLWRIAERPSAVAGLTNVRVEVRLKATGQTLYSISSLRGAP